MPKNNNVDIFNVPDELKFSLIDKKFEELDANRDETTSKLNALETDVKEIKNTLNAKSDTSDLATKEELKNAQRILQNRINNISTKVEEKADASSLDTKCDQIRKEVSTNKKDAAVNALVSKYKLNTAMFFFAVMVINIVAIWLVIYRPTPTSIIQTGNLSWFAVLPLLAVTLVNSVSMVISINYFCKPAKEYLWEIIVEIASLILNTVIIWVFAYCPLNTVSPVLIAATVFLMLSDVWLTVGRLTNKRFAGFLFTNLVNAIFLVIAVGCYIGYGASLA